jgi:hypothetical protein
MATKIDFPKGAARNQLLKVAKAAPMFGVSADVLTAAIKRGNIPGYYVDKTGGLIWFVSKDVAKAYSTAKRAGKE